MDPNPNLPAPTQSTALVEHDRAEVPPLAPRQDITVAFVPLALVVLIIAMIVASAWTFLAATGA